MKKFCSLILAIVILSAIGICALMLPGRMSIAEAATVSVTVVIVSIFAPILVAWIKRLLTHN